MSKALIKSLSWKGPQQISTPTQTQPALISNTALRALSSCVLGSSRDGDPSVSPGPSQHLPALTGKTCFLISSKHLSCSNLWWFSLILLTRSPVKSLGLTSQQPPCQYWRAAVRCLPSLFFSRMKKPSSLSLSSYVQSPDQFGGLWKNCTCLALVSPTQLSSKQNNQFPPSTRYTTMSMVQDAIKSLGPPARRHEVAFQVTCSNRSNKTLQNWGNP